MRIRSIIWTSRCCVQVSSLVNESSWPRGRPRGQVGDSIVTAETSRTAHNRATLIEHRPMPYYGAVNASVIIDQAARVVQAQGIRTPPGSLCVYACIMDGGQPKCPTTAQTGSFSAQGPNAKLRRGENSLVADSGRLFRLLCLCYVCPFGFALPGTRYHGAATLVN